MAVLTKKQWEAAGKLGYATYDEYLRAEGGTGSDNYYADGTGQGTPQNTATSSEYGAQAKKPNQGTIVISQFGQGRTVGRPGAPETVYGDTWKMSSSSEIKDLWSRLRNENDPRIQSFIDTYANGNAKVAKAIWDDAANYASDLASAGKSVDFFNDVINSQVFATEVLSIPKNLLGTTAAKSGPIPYSREYNELSARDLINGVWNDVLGRDAGPGEIANLVKKLNAESKKNPTITSGGVTTEGFNADAAKAFLTDQAKKSSGYKQYAGEKLDALVGKALPGVSLDAIKGDPGFANVQSLFDKGNEAGALRALKDLSTVTGIQEKAAAGALASSRENLAKYATSMGIADLVGGQWLDEAAKAVEDGLATEDYYNAQLKDLAKGAYPGLAAAIDAGQTVAAAASPYIYAMSNILEIPREQLTVGDNMIKSALNARDKEGKIVQKSLWEFEQDLRNDPRWGYTKNARESLDSVAHSVLKDFGLMY